jgi:diguanylate cyclase
VRTVEALVRWRRPDGSLQMPDDFIPEAEENGDIVDIGTWVLDEAVRQAAAWHRSGRAITVAVNVSPLQIDHGTLLARVHEALLRSQLPAEVIELEVTETRAVQCPARARVTMRQLRRLGVNLALDDFGKGHAGVSTLRWLPATTIKIDKELIDDLRRTGAARRLVAGLIAFAHRLGASCVAEGVETTTQLSTLRDLGCDLAQGFLFSRPVEGNRLRASYHLA